METNAAFKAKRIHFSEGPALGANAQNGIYLYIACLGTNPPQGEYNRSRAWSSAVRLLERGVLQVQDLRARKGHFLELLRSGDPNVRFRAWSSVDALVRAGGNNQGRFP